MKRCLIAMCLSVLTGGAALAQIVNHVAYIHENETRQDSKSDVIAKSDGIEKEVTVVVAEPQSATSSLPPTMTVRTAALLELHGMRQSAVALCLQLPTKYRTRLPQCADIFKHEIRLQALAKDRK
ncbi:MAG: hypothetical protein ACLPN2_20600 [Terriglobales bacterium]